MGFRWLSGKVQHLSWKYHPSLTMLVKYNHFSFIPLRDGNMILCWNLFTLHNCTVVRVFPHLTSTILPPSTPQLQPPFQSTCEDLFCFSIYNEGPQPRSQKCWFLRPQKQAPCRARLPELGLCSQDSMHWAATSAAWDWRPRVAGARMVLAETLL